MPSFTALSFATYQRVGTSSSQSSLHLSTTVPAGAFPWLVDRFKTSAATVAPVAKDVMVVEGYCALLCDRPGKTIERLWFLRLRVGLAPQSLYARAATVVIEVGDSRLRRTKMDRAECRGPLRPAVASGQ
jgi:hypothetical protein